MDQRKESIDFPNEKVLQVEEDVWTMIFDGFPIRMGLE